MEKLKGALLKGLLAFFALVILVTVGWTWITLSYDYANGERAGYVQKFSRKGWICKTWEGELSMINYPGAAPETFYFTVRDDAVAKQIEAAVGRRVALHYEQHVAVPSSCFGDTEYFVTGLKVIAEP